MQPSGNARIEAKRREEKRREVQSETLRASVLCRRRGAYGYPSSVGRVRTGDYRMDITEALLLSLLLGGGLSAQRASAAPASVH